jgi:hypothetical protein
MSLGETLARQPTHSSPGHALEDHPNSTVSLPRLRDSSLGHALEDHHHLTVRRVREQVHRTRVAAAAGGGGGGGGVVVCVCGGGGGGQTGGQQRECGLTNSAHAAIERLQPARLTVSVQLACSGCAASVQ